MKPILLFAKNHGRIAIFLFILGLGVVWATNVSIHSVVSRQILISLTGAAGLFGLIAGMFAVLVRILFLRRHDNVPSDFSIEDAVRHIEAQKWIGRKWPLIAFVIAAVLATQVVALAAGMLFTLFLVSG